MIILADGTAVSTASAPAVGWGTLALINAGLAESKGRSRWNWFFASLLLGPIATFLVVIWNRPPAKSRTGAP